MKYTFLSESDEKICTLDLDAEDLKKSVRLKNESVSVDQAMPGGLNGRHLFLAAKGAKSQQVLVATNLGTMTLIIQKGEVREDAKGVGLGHKVVKSSLPGKVLKLLCEVGGKVESGHPMLLIEAMKMENEIRAPITGRIEKIHVQPGQKVETGEVLLTLIAEGPSS